MSATIASNVEQVAASVTGRNVPWASDVENSWLPMWLSQAAKKRKLSERPATSGPCLPPSL